MINVGIINIGISNIKSIYSAIDFLGYNVKLISKEKDFQSVSHLILPGVGSFPSAMQGLKNSNLLDSIGSYNKAGKYILGICLGMQILSDLGYENGITNGLGLINGKVEIIKPKNGFFLPHIGWNSISIQKKDKIFNQINDNADYYFVHSYYFKPLKKDNILSYSHYGDKFTSIVNRDNIYGFQFHPEKSQKNGLKLLDNFIRLK